MISCAGVESEDSTARSSRPGRKSQNKKTAKKKTSKKSSSETQAKITVSDGRLLHVRLRESTSSIVRETLNVIIISIIRVQHHIAFSALTLLVWRKKGHPAHKLFGLSMTGWFYSFLCIMSVMSDVIKCCL